ncbi:GNAT family N-acetyltransferase [Desulfobacula toluolica]|uniref:Conserved uncharacterized protein n=1 Tax=Desulfobacula toluolica (strain DSM 7467 / Tol2) TaxID=651182 RepID=K0NGG9_DESTT|nr:GNAT family N-acetyltransferase [Desulfobacula toluolica]CCK78923.1 conserved uncharacterized protein [Desulfobacula toluolica Tol2]
MKITILDSIEKILEFEDEWRELSSRTKTSLFLSFDFIQLVWTVFDSPSHTPLVIVIRENGQTVGIVPFRLSTEKEYGISLRVIRFISEWQGDKPDIITTIDPDRIRQEVYTYLHTDFRLWDKIVLAEQDSEASVIWNMLFSRRTYLTIILDDMLSYFISMEGTWDDYLKQLKQKVRSNYRNRTKRLEKLPGELKVLHFEDRHTLEKGLERFIAIENSGWKKDAKIGIGQNRKHIAFYAELLGRFSLRNQAGIYLLNSNSTDIAGLILLKYNDVIYESQITFNPNYSKYSPAIVLRADVLKTLFSSSNGSYDMMGMYQQHPKHKSDWATNTKRVVSIHIYKKTRLLLLPIIFAKYIKTTHPALWDLVKRLFSRR